MNFWEQLQARKKLIKTFKKSGLFLGNEDRYILPRILNISSEKITFILPTGLDPKNVRKNFYVFQQVYGSDIEIEGDIKTFTLHLKQIPKTVHYDYESLQLEKYRLPILAGVDRNGKTIIYDMVSYPHLLIAGETGSGKSTQLRAILTTLIQALYPEQLQLYLCDMKRSEFHIFRHVRHVHGPFITVRELYTVLLSLRMEMQRRGDQLDRYEVAHIDDLPSKLPYIVLCIDEVALLQKEKNIMDIVEEISAIGRALGVFLILSMQRPDSEVLDGKLKVNLTVRMGFKTADLINSKIIGTPGSEKIKHPGKFLLKAPMFEDLTEITSHYLSIEKAKEILELYKNKKAQIKQDFIQEQKEIEEDIFGVLE